MCCHVPVRSRYGSKHHTDRRQLHPCVTTAHGVTAVLCHGASVSGPTDVLDQRRAGQEEPFSVPQLPPLALHWQSIKAPMPSFTPARVDEEPHPPFRRPAVPAHMMPSCSAPTATVPQAAVSLQDIMDKLRQQDERIAKMELSLKNKLVEIAQAQSKHMTKKKSMTVPRT